MLKYYFDVQRNILVSSAGQSYAALDSAQMNSTLGQKDIINIQLVNSDNTNYTEIPASYVARFLVDIDYQNPGVPLPLGNTGWTLSSGAEYSIPFTIGTPTTVTFNSIEATLGSVGTLTAGQYAYASNKIYVRLADDTNPNTKDEDWVLVTVANPNATPLAIESSSDVFNLTNTWLDTNGSYRDPDITAGEITFTINSNTINFYNKLADASSVTGFAEIQFYNTTQFVFKFKIPKYFLTNRLLTSGENPVELVGVDVYTKTESDGRYLRKPVAYTAGNIVMFASDGNAEDSTYVASTLSRLPTVNEKAALTASNTPSGSNAFATMLDLSAFAGGLIIKANWNASTNTPDITGVTITGWGYIVTVAGSTDLGGITDWQVGDWAIKTDSGWAKIDNSETYKVKADVDDATPGYLSSKVDGTTIEVTAGDVLAVKDGGLTVTKFNSSAIASGTADNNKFTTQGYVDDELLKFQQMGTASNLGTGTGIFAQKSGVDLQFKSLTSTGTSLALTNTSTTVNIDLATTAITSRTEKTTPVSGDFLLITDSEASNAFKKVDIANISGGGGLSWSVISTSITASASNGYLIDATSGAVNLTLPASPSVGDEIGIRALNSDNTITILRNSLKIESSEEDYTVTSKTGFSLVYSGTTYGWVVVTEIDGLESGGGVGSIADTDVAVDSSGFTGNLSTDITNVHEALEEIDALSLGGSPDDSTTIIAIRVFN